MGNCLDRSQSEDDDSSDETSDVVVVSEQITLPETSRHHRNPRTRRHRHHCSTTSSNSYTRISESLASLASSSLFNVQGNGRQNNANSNDAYSSSSLSSASGESAQQVYYLTPNVQRTADQLTEADQIKLLKRMTLIQQLPTRLYNEEKKNKECAICMIDFELNDETKYLPCLHTYHKSCIDQWLIRSLICPSCIQPVDAGLLTAFDNA